MINDFIEAIKKGNKETKSAEVEAVVKGIDRGTVWVSIPGMDGTTPVQKTLDCKPGDTVTVRIEGGKGRITGNLTTPPTGDTAVKKLSEMIRNELQALESRAMEKILDIKRDGVIRATSYRNQDGRRILETKGATQSTGSIAAGASKTVAVDIGTIDGKKLTGVAGIKITGTNSEYCALQQFFINGTDEISVTIKNTGSAAAIWTVRATGLYITN